MLKLDARNLLVALTVLVVAVGCGPSELDGIAAAATDEVRLADFLPDDGTVAGGRYGYVIVSRSQRSAAATAARTATVGVRGFFMEHQGFERGEALAALGVPQLHELPPIGHCAVFHEALDSADRADTAAASDAWVDLLDAGTLTLRLGSFEIPVDSSYFPDVVSFVSGLMYGSVARVPVRRSSPETVVLEGLGGGDVGSFSVTLDAPSDIRILSVGGAVPMAGTASIPSSGALKVTWTPGAATDEPVMLELSRVSFGRVDTVRCAAIDDGAFLIPGALRARLPEHTEPATDRISVRRLVAAELIADGIDEGWAFFVSDDFILLSPGP